MNRHYPLQHSSLLNLDQTYGLIAVTGQNAQSFLQGQLTRDIRTVDPQNPGFSAYCNPKGRIRALLRVFYSKDTYYLQLPLEILPQTLTTLNNYGRFSKISLYNCSQTWKRIGILLVEHTAEAILAHCPLTPEIFILHLPGPRLELLAPASILSPVVERLSAILPTEASSLWKLWDIQTGIPEIWQETTEQFLPHYLNLPALGAISFTKGCYCGQEIIARMEYRAEIKRTLFRAALPIHTLLPNPNTPVMTEDNNLAGFVVSAYMHPNNTIEVLIETQEAYIQSQQPLFIQQQPLTILPFLIS